MRCLGERLSARSLPLRVHLFASCRSCPLRISLQDVLLAYRCLLLNIEPEDGGTPPYDRSPAGTRHMEAGSNRSSWGRNALASAVQHAVVAERWTSGCGAGCAL